jgi:hypothetical protein
LSGSPARHRSPSTLAAGPCDASPRRHDTGVEAHRQPHPLSSKAAVVGTTVLLPRQWRGGKHGGPSSTAAAVACTVARGSGRHIATGEEACCCGRGRRVATGVEAHMQPHPPSSTVAVVGKTTLPRRWRWPLDVDPDKAVAGSNLGLVGLDSGSGFFFKN